MLKRVLLKTLEILRRHICRHETIFASLLGGFYTFPYILFSILWQLDRNCVRYKFWCGTRHCSSSGDGQQRAATISNFYGSQSKCEQGNVEREAIDFW